MRARTVPYFDGSIFNDFNEYRPFVSLILSGINFIPEIPTKVGSNSAEIAWTF